ncbi:restriction endonuclease subunit S [Aeromonas allosaccharophila]
MAEQMMQNKAAEMAPKQTIPAGYKMTEVGVIPNDWLVRKIGDISEVIRGASPRPKGDKRFYGGSVPRLMVEDVSRDGKNVTPSVDSLTEAGAKLSRPCVVGTLTLVCSGVVGVPSILAVDACIHDGFLGITKVKKSVLIDYLYHFFTTQQEKLNNSATHGGVFTNLTTDGVRDFIIAIPADKEEQTAIANVLSDSDALIGALEQLIAKKQAIKTAAMQQLLTGRTRLPQFALRPDGTPKGYKSSELGQIPEDWEASKMGSLAQIQRGASPRPIDSPIWFDRNSSVGWLRISDVTRTDKYLSETTQALSQLGVSHSRFVPSGNLVMSICATVGKPIITKIDLCIHDGFVVFNRLLVNQNYMYYVLKKLENDWGKQGQTGSQMNLNTELINGTLVLLPLNSEEQTAIATILSDMDSELTALEQKLAKVRSLKQGMMQQLLTGRIRLPLEVQA